MFPLNTADDFWLNVQKGDGCWIWTGARLKAGYGRIRWQRKQSLAHRVAWVVVNGEIGDGLCVLHRCDNPPCVRPEHLFLGTKTENIADRHLKGRSASGDRNGSRTKPERLARGEANHKSILTAANVVEARRLRRTTGISFNKLAKQFSVSVYCVRSAVIGKTWRHIGEII